MPLMVRSTPDDEIEGLLVRLRTAKNGDMLHSAAATLICEMRGRVSGAELSEKVIRIVLERSQRAEIDLMIDLQMARESKQEAIKYTNDSFTRVLWSAFPELAGTPVTIEAIKTIGDELIALREKVKELESRQMVETVTLSAAASAAEFEGAATTGEVVQSTISVGDPAPVNEANIWGWDVLHSEQDGSFRWGKHPKPSFTGIYIQHNRMPQDEQTEEGWEMALAPGLVGRFESRVLAENAVNLHLKTRAFQRAKDHDAKLAHEQHGGAGA